MPEPQTAEQSIQSLMGKAGIDESEDKLTSKEVSRISAALSLGKEQEDSSDQTLEGAKHALENALTLLQKEIAEKERIQRSYETLLTQHQNLAAQVEVYKSTANAAAIVGADHPAVGTNVTFVNHAGQPEKAVVINHGTIGVGLEVQGAHKNDKSVKMDVPRGGPGRKLTYY